MTEMRDDKDSVSSSARRRRRAKAADSEDHPRDARFTARNEAKVLPEAAAALERDRAARKKITKKAKRERQKERKRSQWLESSGGRHS
ncbi:MAG: hypothetical protein EKK29_09535 [Hyphomicrobiales bacterium]|nr:MAG: hypothetical protein EKK29_09535 [Hyphomicrobiales bacterium]